MVNLILILPMVILIPKQPMQIMCLLFQFHFCQYILFMFQNCQCSLRTKIAIGSFSCVFGEFVTKNTISHNGCVNCHWQFKANPTCQLVALGYENTKFGNFRYACVVYVTILRLRNHCEKWFFWCFRTNINIGIVMAHYFPLSNVI